MTHESSRNIDKKNVSKYENSYIYIYMEFCIKEVGLNRSYSANMQLIFNDNIQEKPNCNLGLLQL